MGKALATIMILPKGWTANSAADKLDKALRKAGVLNGAAENIAAVANKFFAKYFDYDLNAEAAYKGTSIYYKNFHEGALVCIHRGEKPSC